MTVDTASFSDSHESTAETNPSAGLQNPGARIELDYHFSEMEIKLLVRIFRNQEEHIPDGLVNFVTKIERAIYNSMSIGEAEAFFA